MKEILDGLVDGHPNPEGFIEWCESLSDEEFMIHFQPIEGDKLSITISDLIERLEAAIIVLRQVGYIYTAAELEMAVTKAKEELRSHLIAKLSSSPPQQPPQVVR